MDESDKPAVINYQVHTVLLTADKRQGVALGVNPAGGAFRIWLLTPRAVELALERLRAVTKALGGTRAPKRIKSASRERSRRLAGVWRKDREWNLR
jgi:hypothetical protein